MNEIDNRLISVIDRQPYPLLFITISGAHLYGFASPDSDYDLRGIHKLPLTDKPSAQPALNDLLVRSQLG